MEVHVTPLKSKGQTKQKWLRAMGNAVGTLRIRDKRDTVNLRSTRVAELFNHRPVRAEGEKWILFDVQLVWAKGGSSCCPATSATSSGTATLRITPRVGSSACRRRERRSRSSQTPSRHQNRRRSKTRLPAAYAFDQQ